jgi:D-amino-acid dehydrogenase
MHALVLGSGVIGVTTAYYLNRAGHEVTVVDRREAAGMETSFANAGQISPGYSAPWAGPGVPLQAIKWLLMKHRPFVLRPLPDPALWRWLVHMLRYCTAEDYQINKLRMLRLARYSRDCLEELRHETNIEYDHRMRGTLQLFRTAKQIDQAYLDIAILRRLGMDCEFLTRDGCVGVEPALRHVRHRFIGGLRLPGDETGDAHLFTRRLADLAAANGVRFIYQTDIQSLRRLGDRLTGIETSRGPMCADNYVLALASFSPKFLTPLGISLPVYPVKGYSITVPIADEEFAPVSTVMDETYKIAITRLGNRIRVGGTAELVGYCTRLRKPRRAALEHSLNDLFPWGGNLAESSFWSGLRAMTPDGPPIIGPTCIGNLYLNTGHGTLGWTMACGSGRLLADLLSRRTPDIDSTDLAIGRYNSRGCREKRCPK